MFLDVLRKFIEDETPRYIVRFERKLEGALIADHFPDIDAGEKGFKTEAKAWLYARNLAEISEGDCFNIYVATDDFVPVDNYKKKILSPYIPPPLEIYKKQSKKM